MKYLKYLTVIKILGQGLILKSEKLLIVKEKSRITK